MVIAPTLGQNGCSTGWNVTFDPASGNLMAGGRVVSLSESELAALRAWVTSTAGLDSVGYDTASGTIKSEGVSVTLNQVENTAVRALLADAITRTEADAAYADKATEDLAALAESTAVQAKSAVEALAEKAVTAEVNQVTGGLELSGAKTAPVVSAEGLTIRVGAFSAQGFSFSGGALDLVPSGVWYVGVDLLRGVLIALPRLGHRGWIPVAHAVTDDSAVTTLRAISPVVPSTRIPRTLAKLRAKQPISVIVMGSSLTQGGNTTDWPGMLFNAASSNMHYRVPGSVTVQYRGVGGSPNQYQLAQTGLACGSSSLTYDDAGSPRVIRNMASMPNGRSTMFKDVDLVVLGCLANGGEYRLESIEPTVRNLRRLGVEVILVSDNPQGPSAAYSTMATAALYVDGPEVQRIADLMGVEYADTAAYVFEAHLRYGAGIYGDTIHMAGAAPAGRTARPSCGHEVWARAIRSLITMDAIPGAPQTLSYDFSTGAQGWVSYSRASVSASSGALAVTKNTSSVDQWGAWIATLPAIAVGDSIRVRGTVVSGASGADLTIGLQNAGGASNVVSLSDGAFDATLTAHKDSTTLLFYGANNAAANGTAFVIDNVVIDVTPSVGVLSDITPGRAHDSRPIPPSRIVSDIKTPGDAHIMLPSECQFVVTGNPNKGTLGAHPWGSGSFARTFSAGYDAAKDLLSVPAGKSCGFAGIATVGLSIIRYADQNDAPCTIDVYRNGVKQKTLTFATPPFGNEWYSTIYTPTEFNNSGIGAGAAHVTLAVTSGTLKIAAFVALTADVEIVPPERLSFVGAWPFREQDGGTATRGIATDTVGDYAYLKCPETGRRVFFLLASRSNSQPVDIYSDRERALGVVTNGINNFRACGGLLGPGGHHVIKLNAAAASPAVGNRSLHVSGAVIVNDR